MVAGLHPNATAAFSSGMPSFHASVTRSLFDTLTDLKTSLRASLSYFQTVRHKVKSLIEGRPKRKTAK